jgi:site-specific recombinase XerD
MRSQKTTDLAVSLQGFFRDYLPSVRGMSIHTIRSYRDSLKLLLRFLAREDERAVANLCLGDVDSNMIIEFLNHIETIRGNSVGTRNIRLAAIHCFFRYVASAFPQHLLTAQQILGIPFKRAKTREVEYLEFDEIAALMKQVDRGSAYGRRDYALLLLMFNTGGRVQEIIDLKATDFHLQAPCSIRFFGKGRKERTCPIWTSTAEVMRQHFEDNNIEPRKAQAVFTNHMGTALTRFGVRHILAKYARLAAATNPDLGAKRLHPHSMRHSTAVHLLKSGVELNTIASWLGHASPNTTNKYATVDMDIKREAIAKAAPITGRPKRKPSWHSDRELLAWLESL